MTSIDIRFGGYQGPFSVHNRAVTVFGDALAQSLGDDLKFAHTPNVIDQGHTAVDLLDMVTSGEMTFCYFASSYLADRVAEFALLDLPFAIRDRTQAYALLDDDGALELLDEDDEDGGALLDELELLDDDDEGVVDEELLEDELLLDEGGTLELLEEEEDDDMQVSFLECARPTLL